MLARLLYHTARVRTDTDETANSRGGIPSLGKLDKIPGFRDLIAGRCVLDFGCGRGYEVVAMALAGAARVVGLDIQDRPLERGRVAAQTHGVADRVCFTTCLDPSERFDVVTSVNSFEHFADPDAILAQMRSVLAPAGRIVITFGPPWYAPFGAHQMHWCPFPWVHLLFSERTVLRARARIHKEHGLPIDGATRYEDILGSLNRMSRAKFERMIERSGLACDLLEYGYVKGARTDLPVLRELLTNNIAAVLSEPA